MNRRDLLKSTVAMGAGSLLTGVTTSAQQEHIHQAKPSAAAAVFGSPRRWLMDFDWRFALGHASDPERDFGFGGASRELTFAKADRMTQVAAVEFDDGAWQRVCLPHDWAVELPFVHSKEIASHGSRPIGREFPATSVGWYRKHFNIRAEDADQRFALDFDGIFRDAMVFLNGYFLGRHASGYAPYTLDVTDYLTYGGTNVLTVRVDASYGEGWFYEGAGIYRHVWLRRYSALHVVHDGVLIDSKPASGNAADIVVRCEVRNLHRGDLGCNIEHRVYDADEREVLRFRSDGIRIPAGEMKEVIAQARLKSAHLWSLESPYRYRMETRVLANGEIADVTTRHFGIRTIRFDPDKGFFLNGVPVKIKGTCNHQDHAGVGVALPDFLHRYRLERLRSFGSNACRTTHHPATAEFLDECDRQGMLVMAEVRMMASTPEGLSQMESMVRRDRNRPSVILWSLGNEEPSQGTDRAMRIVRSMRDQLRTLDSTRPVTVAMNNDWGKGVSAVVDVQGCNYNRSKIDAFHAAFSRQPLIGTETASTFSTRGEYANDPIRGVVSAYDVNPPAYGDTAEQWWQLYERRKFLAGGFVWTGFDYRGEPNPYVDVSVSSQFGVLDTCGFPKDNFYYYKSWWGSDPVLHLFPHWNWRADKTVEVWCHSNLDSVELLLNGVSQGEKPVPRMGHVSWKVRYQPGTLEARGKRNGTQLMVDRRVTTSSPHALRLTVDREGLNADGEDGCVISVTVEDAMGNTVPDASNQIVFEISGPGQIIGVGNGDPNSREADKAATRQVFHGLACAIVQADRTAGEIQVMASSHGLASASLAIRTVDCVRRSAL